jgi:hypothetical protein
MEQPREVEHLSLRGIVHGLACALATLLPILVHADPAIGSRGAVTEGSVELGPEPGPARRGEIVLRPFYRSDELRFTIDGGGIDIISELDWDDVRSAGLELDGKVRLPGPFELSGHAAYGRIYDGSLRDSDYNGSGKTLEFSRSRSDTERGSTLDLSFALGVPYAPSARWRLIPLVGLCYSEENYNLRNGVQVVPALGPFGGLDSDYETQWYGVLWGGELHWLPNEDWDLMARFTSRHANYRADGHFNLRSDLAQRRSFGQATTGRGSIYELGAKRALGAGFTLDLNTRWDVWDTRHGSMDFFFASGGSSRQGLNEVELETFRVSLGLGYTF